MSEYILEIYLILFFILILGYFIYQNHYFKSNEFNEIKKSIEKFTEDCNNLNHHIEELKDAYINFKKTDYGTAQYFDTSRFMYKRPKLRKQRKADNIYNCSLTVCRNAQQQPFKYICKYFNIQQNEETLEQFEKILNDFSAAEQGKILLKQQREIIISSVIKKIPFLIRTISKKKLVKKLGFEDIDFSNLYFPKFSFNYVSAGGNSSMNCNVVLNIKNLDRFIHYLSETINFKKSIAGQRALMTSTLREKIKQRDNYSCKICNLGIKEEPNLLLEIDHIIPLSKGGTTTEDNLQTLCWRCNRKKGSKMIETDETE